MLKRRYRYAIDTLVIVAAVAIGLFVLSQWQEQQRGVRLVAAATPPPPPTDPWTPSPDYDAEANADFALQSSASGNVRLAGTEAGADWPNFNGPRRENKSLEHGLLRNGQLPARNSPGCAAA